ncbi:MAG: glycosyltransferase [Myxococcaceae bacterium]|nr:glycosyltransferase [Myxococcaceae bacterium]MBH2006787.1 glycosyltransferase [Myxococcaceae bacterium]
MIISFFTTCIGNGPIVKNNYKTYKYFKNNFNKDLKCHYVTTEEHPHWKDVEIVDVEIFNLKSKKAVTMLLKYWCYVRREKPTFVVASGPLQSMIALLVRLVFRGKEKIIVNNHTVMSIFLEEQKTFIDRKLLKYIIMFLYQFSDLILAISKDVAEDLERFLKLPNGTVMVAYNPSYDEKILSLRSEKNSHKWFLEGRTVVITAARLSPEKDISTLLKSFEILRKKFDCRLLILGRGELLEQLKNEARLLAIEPWVDFVGFVPNPFSYFARASVFVLSSVYEGFGNVLIEALACNCPCVATRCPGGPREILDDGRYGLLVEVGNARAMADAIERQISMPNRDGIQNRASEFSVENTRAVLGMTLWAKLRMKRSSIGEGC